MKSSIIALIKYIILWLIFFIVAKVFFLISNYHLTFNLTLSEIKGILFYGLKMDLSTACYLTVIPGILFSFSFFIPVHKIIKGYTWFLFTLIIILFMVDLSIYPHWGTRVSITTFNYLENPGGIFASIIIVELIKVFIIGIIMFFIFKWLYKLLIDKNKYLLKRDQWYYAPVILIIVASLFIPIRGGLDTSPINLSSVYFSNKLYVNHSTSNYLWNFGRTIEMNVINSNPCVYMESQESLRLFEEKHSVVDSAKVPAIIEKHDEPVNVILIILESFSNKVLESFGGLPGITPNMDTLSKEGIVFSSMYASGNRSDRGLSAILGGYPSLLNTSIILSPDKSATLTLLPHYFEKENYSTSFYYGGDIEFYNIKSFALQAGYDKIISKDDFSKKIERMSSWGVPDEYIFERSIEDIYKEKSPFFKVIYTLSSHTPYDVPFHKIDGDTNENMYLNSVAYTDSCIGHFISLLKESDYWNNTLIIITSDHGHIEPGPTEIIDPATYEIPMIWAGGVVKNSRIIEKTCMQSDIMPTILDQLGWETDNFKFGHDIFTSPGYGFYMLDTGWGYVTDEGALFFNNETGTIQDFWGDISKREDVNFAKAFMQVLYEDFLSR